MPTESAISDMNFDLSFVVCTSDRARWADFAAGLLDLMSVMPSRKIELLIVAPTHAPLEIPPNLARKIEIVQIETEWGCRNTSRNQGYDRARGKWVYFLDDDTRFASFHLDPIRETLESLDQLPEDIVMLSGPYLSHPDCSYWGHQYNWLSNLWLENPRSPGRFLAGNLIIRKHALPSPLFSAECKAGGEEIALMERIHHSGARARYRSIYRRQLAVQHKADHTLTRFWTRLRTHQAAKRAFAPGSARETAVNLRVLKEILFTPKSWLALAVYVAAINTHRFVRGEK